MSSIITIGAGTGNSVVAQQFFDRLLDPPVGRRESFYSNLIDGLVALGIFTLLDFLYIFAAADAATALTNLVQTTYMAGLNDNNGGAAPVFVVDRGFTCGGINQDIFSNFNPGTAVSPKFTQNDAMVAVWNLTTTQVNSKLVDQQSQANKIEIWPRFSDGKTYANVNGTEFSPTAGADCSGLFIAQRTASNAQAVYRNDVLLGSNSSTSIAVTDSIVMLGIGSYQLAAAAMGSSLNAAQRTAFYNLLSNYLGNLGAI